MKRKPSMFAYTLLSFMHDLFCSQFASCQSRISGYVKNAVCFIALSSPEALVSAQIDLLSDHCLRPLPLLIRT